MVLKLRKWAILPTYVASIKVINRANLGAEHSLHTLIITIFI